MLIKLLPRIIAVIDFYFIIVYWKNAYFAQVSKIIWLTTFNIFCGIRVSSHDTLLCCGTSVEIYSSISIFIIPMQFNNINSTFIDSYMWLHTLFCTFQLIFALQDYIGFFIIIFISIRLKLFGDWTDNPLWS